MNKHILNVTTVAQFKEEEDLRNILKGSRDLSVCDIYDVIVDTFSVYMYNEKILYVLRMISTHVKE